MSAFRHVEAVFFDIGGPLYDDGNFVDAVLTTLDELRAERSLPPADRDRFAEIYDETRNRQQGSLRSALAAEFLGDAGQRGLLHTRTGTHWTHPEGTLHSDVLPCLRELHGRVRIGVVANQEAAVVDALRRDGAEPYVDVWAVSGIVGVEKPDPELFAWALQEAGTTARHAVHVGNRLDTDVRPARALGLGTVWVLRGEAPPSPTAAQLAEPDTAVRDLTLLPDLLFRLPAPETVETSEAPETAETPEASEASEAVGDEGGPP
ncbi:HAD family hydrolase [Streptomyces marispadix]|uniref:HAD family hydrolase n=1 Tax=Streptomyces marispadix TaxID=2922868 RepID=A0ABS9T4S3_9ACTN|nr:HAD family hydrolase [Streptomyces marispadix]MCH6163527.1 HAD family hydrolase [Streptomyces marispadix]